MSAQIAQAIQATKQFPSPNGVPAKMEEQALVNKQLAQAIRTVQQLSLHLQDAVATRIWIAIEEREWETIANQPHVQQGLSKLAQLALAKKEEVEDGGEIIQSKRVKGFEGFLTALPAEVQEKAEEVYTLFREGSSTSSLRFRQIHHNDPIYSLRIDKNHRAIGWFEDGVVHWFWIGDYRDCNHIDQIIHQWNRNNKQSFELATEAALQFPDDFQAAIAEEIFEEIDEQEWDAIISRPPVQRHIAELAKEAALLYQAGKTVEGGFGTDEESLRSIVLEAS